MKNINIKISISLFSLLLLTWACKEAETPVPSPATTASTAKANFVMINASPDAPSLDMYINNLKVGNSMVSFNGQLVDTYSNIGITLNDGLDA